MELAERHYNELETYLENLNLKLVTRSKHLLYFKHFYEMFGGFVTQKTIDSFLQQKTSPNHKAMISHLINFLKRDDLLNNEEQLEVSRLSILRQVGRKKTNPIHILTKQEVEKVVNNCKLSTALQTKRFSAMVLFQYTSGLRISELCQLKFENLNYPGRTKFENSEKFHDKYQKLFLPPEIAKGNKGAYFNVRTDSYIKYFDFLKYWKVIDLNSVRSVMIGKRNMWGMNKKKYSKLFNEQVQFVLGFRLPDNKSTHILRHSICTHLLEDKMPILNVRDFMRHSSVAVTEKYLHLSEDSLSKELEKL